MMGFCCKIRWSGAAAFYQEQTMKNALAFVAIASCVSALCRAAAPPSLAESLQSCAKMADVTERVRCYDAVAAQTAASPSNPIVPPAARVAAPPSIRTLPPVTPPPAARTAPATGAAPSAAASKGSSVPPPASATAAPTGAGAGGEFGKEQLPKRSRPAPTEANSTMDSSIQNLHVVGAGAYMVSLANGQTWREQGSDKMKFFRIGDEVRIEKGSLGSYQMWTGRIGRKNWVPVQRIE
jgi:hypothetical protein